MILEIPKTNVIFDSGSSVNHIPSQDYNVLINQIKIDNNCFEKYDGSY